MAEVDALGADQEAALREAARAVLAAEVDTDAWRSGPPATASDEALWVQLTNLGWLGLEIPEGRGGAGLGFRELCLLGHEMGRALAGGPFFATTVLGVGAFASASEQQRAEWLPRIAAGNAVVTAAMSGADGVPDRLDVLAEPDGDGWRMHGVAGFVPDAERADAVAVAARDVDGGMTLFLLPTGRKGVDVTPQTTIDASRRLARIEYTAVRAEATDVIGAAGDATDAVHALADRAAIAIAADCVGGAERALEMTVAYLKQRQQFGRAIGTFQALKHRAADMLMSLEAAREAVAHAAAVGAEETQRAAAASIAKEQAGEAYAHIAAEAVSLHGGIGFTWEHDAHLHLKRAGLNRLLYGDSWWHRDRLGRLAVEAVLGERVRLR